MHHSFDNKRQNRAEAQSTKYPILTRRSGLHLYQASIQQPPIIHLNISVCIRVPTRHQEHGVCHLRERLLALVLLLLAHRRMRYADDLPLVLVLLVYLNPKSASIAHVTSATKPPSPGIGFERYQEARRNTKTKTRGNYHAH